MAQAGLLGWVCHSQPFPHRRLVLILELGDFHQPIKFPCYILTYWLWMMMYLVRTIMSREFYVQQKHMKQRVIFHSKRGLVCNYTWGNSYHQLNSPASKTKKKGAGRYEPPGSHGTCIPSVNGSLGIIMLSHLMQMLPSESFSPSNMQHHTPTPGVLSTSD